MRLAEEEIASLLAAESEKRFAYTLNYIAKSRCAWGLYSGGWAMCRNANEDRIFPLWPAAEYAALCASGHHAGFAPRAIELDELISTLIPRLIDDKIALAIFSTQDDNGIAACDPAIFERDLLETLRKYAG